MKKQGWKFLFAYKKQTKRNRLFCGKSQKGGFFVFSLDKFIGGVKWVANISPTGGKHMLLVLKSRRRHLPDPADFLTLKEISFRKRNSIWHTDDCSLL